MTRALQYLTLVLVLVLSTTICIDPLGRVLGLRIIETISVAILFFYAVPSYFFNLLKEQILRRNTAKILRVIHIFYGAWYVSLSAMSIPCIAHGFYPQKYLMLIITISAILVVLHIFAYKAAAKHIKMIESLKGIETPFSKAMCLSIAIPTYLIGFLAILGLLNPFTHIIY